MCGLVVWARVLGASGGGFDSPDGGEETVEEGAIFNKTQCSNVSHVLCVGDTR